MLWFLQVLWGRLFGYDPISKEQKARFLLAILSRHVALTEGVNTVYLRRALSGELGRDFTFGEVYSLLDMLERKGLVASHLVAGTAERNFLPARYCQLTQDALKLLQREA